MIEALEYKTSNEKYPDTFGYMSLGSMILEENNTGYFSFLTMKCLYLKKEFELILINSFFGELLVLGNLDNLPGNFIADREEFMRELKSIVESKIFNDDWLGKNSLIYNQYDQDMKFNIDNCLKNSLYNQYDQDMKFNIDNYGKNTSITC